MSDDRRVIVCNYTVDTRIAAAGAKAYVSWPLGGNLPERIQVVARSRSGRLVHKWEPMHRLTDFRAVTLPPEHPRYADERVVSFEDESVVSRLNGYATSAREERDRD